MLTEEERKENRKKAVSKYQKSEKGKACIKRVNRKRIENGYYRRYSRLPSQIERMKKYHLYWKTTEAGKKYRSRNKRSMFSKYPERDLARKAVWYAVKVGKIAKVTDLICHSCKEDASHYHHFMGYTKEHYLSVIPLCMNCHIKVHQ